MVTRDPLLWQQQWQQKGAWIRGMVAKCNPALHILYASKAAREGGRIDNCYLTVADYSTVYFQQGFEIKAAATPAAGTATKPGLPAGV